MQKRLTVLICALVANVSSGAIAAPLISASGLDGAGLGLVPGQQGRAWGDMAYHSQEDTSILAPTLGVSFLPSQNLELGLMMPFTRVSADDDSETELGNMTVGLAYVNVDGPVRVTAGLAAALPTASESGRSMLVNVLGLAPTAYQHLALRFPGVLGILVPLHLEGGDGFVGHLDGELITLFSTGDVIDETILLGTMAPGFGGWLGGDRVALGVRVPLFINISQDNIDDRAQVSVEPYLRINLGSQGFLGLRFNVPVDDPLKQIDMWGLHLGGGGAF